MVLQQNYNKMLALLLNVIPGLGHYYIGRRGRTVIYPLLFFGTMGAGLFLYMISNGEEAVIAFTLIGMFLFWSISMLDLLVSLLRMPASMPMSYNEGGEYQAGYAQGSGYAAAPRDNERFFTILLSVIPGLGHFHLGLMQRGLSFLISFFGLLTILVFLAGITRNDVFLLFIGLLPIIWLYCMFDAAKLAHMKQRGELLEDRTLFSEFESGRDTGKRSKTLATLLSAFPGAGHLYLGLQKKGLQLMLLFVGAIYILDFLRLSLFLFLIPVIWCYSFFDALQQVSKYGKEPLTDRPLVQGLENYKGLIGLALLIIGLYYIFNQVIVPVVELNYPDLRLSYRIDRYLSPIIVSVLLIWGGVKLLLSRKK